MVKTSTAGSFKYTQQRFGHHCRHSLCTEWIHQAHAEIKHVQSSCLCLRLFSAKETKLTSLMQLMHACAASRLCKLPWKGSEVDASSSCKERTRSFLSKKKRNFLGVKSTLLHPFMCWAQLPFLERHRFIGMLCTELRN